MMRTGGARDRIRRDHLTRLLDPLGPLPATALIVRRTAAGGKGPVAQRSTFTMRVVHKLASGGFMVKAGAPKRVSEISAVQVPITCDEGEDAFTSAVSFELPRNYKLRGKNLNVAARFKAVRSYRHVNGQQLRVVMRGKLTKRGKRATGTLTIVSSSSGATNCKSGKTPWSGRADG
jgi:hypothetical protein